MRLGLLGQRRQGRLLRFLVDPDIPPTNNAAERSLRSVVIARLCGQDPSRAEKGMEGILDTHFVNFECFKVFRLASSQDIFDELKRFRQVQVEDPIWW